MLEVLQAFRLEPVPHLSSCPFPCWGAEARTSLAMTEDAGLLERRGKSESFIAARERESVCGFGSGPKAAESALSSSAFTVSARGTLELLLDCAVIEIATVNSRDAPAPGCFLPPPNQLPPSSTRAGFPAPFRAPARCRARRTEGLDRLPPALIVRPPAGTVVLHNGLLVRLNPPCAGSHSPSSIFAERPTGMRAKFVRRGAVRAQPDENGHPCGRSGAKSVGAARARQQEIVDLFCCSLVA